MTKSEIEAVPVSQQVRASLGVTYRWSYHPDNGLNMVIEER